MSITVSIKDFEEDLKIMEDAKKRKLNKNDEAQQDLKKKKLNTFEETSSDENDFDIFDNEIKPISEKDQFWKDFINEIPSLSKIQQMVDELSATTSSLAKKEIMLKFKDCIKILYYTSNPYFQFNIKSVRVSKSMADTENWSSIKPPKNIFDLLDLLRNRTITGNTALFTVCAFVKENRKYENLIYNIIDKKLKTRAKGNTINAVFPGLIPLFQVARGYDIKDVPGGHIDYENVKWFASRKFDGVRLICMIRNGLPEFRSREGNIFCTLQVLEKIIKSFKLKDNMVLDGELCIFDDEKEDFKKAVSEIRRKSGMIVNPRFCVFDMLTIEEFESRKSKRKYSERYENLKKFLSSYSHEPFITCVEQVICKDENHVKMLSESAFKKEWEGLILRRDFAYEGKKSNNMLKIKKFIEEEFPCIGHSTSVQRIFIDGKELETETLKNITVDIGNGNKVDVGSGFDPKERMLYYENPELIVGHIVTISYAEMSENDKGKPSLRFPTFKAVHGKAKRKI